MPRDAVAAIELEDPARDVVEEVAIVRHGDHGAGEFLQEPLEPRDGFRVEMVRGLVEQQHVGVRQQQPAQRHAAAFAAGQRLYVRIPRRQAQRVGRDVELALELPAAGRIDRVLQLALLLEQAIHLVVFERLARTCR